MERYALGFYDPAMADKLDFLTMGSGTSVDAPTQLYVQRPDKYRQTIFDAISYSHSKNKGFMYLISPNTSGADFLAHAQRIVRDLEDRNLEPEFYAVELYGLRPYTLTPETVVNAQGKRVSANTITGVAHWLIKHLRADEQELDLWINTPQGNFDKGTTRTSGTSPGLNLANWTGSNGTWTATLNAHNRSTWLELSPMLKGGVSGLPAGWTVTYSIAGKNISAASLAAGLAYVGTYRLAPGASTALTIKLSKAGATSLPAGVKLQWSLYSHRGGQFLRDTVLASATPVSGLQVLYTFPNSWTGGATTNIQIMNNGTQAINDWTISFQLPAGQTVVDGWNATISGTSGTITAKALDWNKTIAPGASASFGYNLRTSSPLSKPPTCTLNGQVLTIAP
jgi:hypothetical protein